MLHSLRFSGCVLDVPKMQSGWQFITEYLEWVDNSAIRFIRFRERSEQELYWYQLVYSSNKNAQAPKLVHFL